jgi:glycosyltransferase involved in cell wall biosynthesis
MITIIDIVYLFRVKRKYIPDNLHIVTITDIDSLYVKKILKRNRIVTIPNGVDLPALRIDDHYIASKKKSNMVLFFGSLDYQPNKDSIAFILDHLWPDIVYKYPELQLVIAGRNPDPSLTKQMKNVKNGNLYADVADPASFYAKARFTLMPIYSGGGMKNKILESFACGTPIITTPEGAIGIAMEHTKHCFIGNFKQELLDCVSLILSLHSSDYKMLVFECRKLAEKYTWASAATQFLSFRQHGKDITL